MYEPLQVQYQNTWRTYDGIEVGTHYMNCSGTLTRWWYMAYVNSNGFNFVWGSSSVGTGSHAFSLYKTGSYTWNFKIDSTVVHSEDFSSEGFGSFDEAWAGLEPNDDYASTGIHHYGGLQEEIDGSSWINWTASSSRVDAAPPTLTGCYGTTSSCGTFSAMQWFASAS